MRVPGLIFASEEMLDVIGQDQAIEQVANVAFLPGIVRYSMAMPDIHWGYGFPIGGGGAGGGGGDGACPVAGRRRLRHQLRHAATENVYGIGVRNLAVVADGRYQIIQRNGSDRGLRPG